MTFFGRIFFFEKTQARSIMNPADFFDDFVRLRLSSVSAFRKVTNLIRYNARQNG